MTPAPVAPSLPCASAFGLFEPTEDDRAFWAPTSAKAKRSSGPAVGISVTS